MEEILRIKDWLDLNLGPWMRGEDLMVEDFLDCYPVDKSVEVGQRECPKDTGKLNSSRPIKGQMEDGDGVDHGWSVVHSQPLDESGKEWPRWNCPRAFILWVITG